MKIFPMAAMLTFLTLISIVVTPLPATSATISLEASSSLINIGETAYLDVVVSNLGGSYISTFDFDVSYDAAVLAFSGYSLGVGLGDPLSEAYDDSIGDSSPPGTINIAEVSLLPDFSSVQDGDTLTLATLSFTGFATGSSTLSLAPYLAGDEWGAGITFSDSPLGVTFEVASSGVSPVPEPATMLLFAAGCGILGFRRMSR